MNSSLYLVYLISHCVDRYILMWLIDDNINVILPNIDILVSLLETCTFHKNLSARC